MHSTHFLIGMHCVAALASAKWAKCGKRNKYFLNDLVRLSRVENFVISRATSSHVVFSRTPCTGSYVEHSDAACDRVSQPNAMPQASHPLLCYKHSLWWAASMLATPLSIAVSAGVVLCEPARLGFTLCFVLCFGAYVMNALHH